MFAMYLIAKPNNVNVPQNVVNIFITGINESIDITLNNSPIVFAPAKCDKIISHATEIIRGNQYNKKIFIF